MFYVNEYITYRDGSAQSFTLREHASIVGAQEQLRTIVNRRRACGCRITHIHGVYTLVDTNETDRLCIEEHAC